LLGKTKSNKAKVEQLMKPIGKKVITSAIAAAVIFSGAGLVHNQVFAASATGKSPSGIEQKGKTNGAGFRDGAGSQEKGKRGSLGGIKSGNLVTETASILGIEEAAVREQLQQGQTLSQIAVAAGLTEEDYLAKLTALATAAIDASLSEGKITQEQADTLKSGLAERLKQQVANTGVKGIAKDARGGKGHGGRFVDDEALSGILGLSAEEIRTQQQAGKSLAEIAEAQGITEDQLISKIKDSLTDELKSFVESKGGSAQHPGKTRPTKPSDTAAPTPSATEGADTNA
jgi:predicted transcriptional regulator